MSRQDMSFSDIQLTSEFVSWLMSRSKTIEDKIETVHMIISDIETFTTDNDFFRIIAAIHQETQTYLSNKKVGLK